MKCAVGAIVAGLFGLLSPAAGQQPADRSSNSENERLAFMKRQVIEFQLAPQADPDQAYSLNTTPVMHFTNPVRDTSSDGALFLWLRDERPVAAASLWIRANGEFGRDFVSLSPKPLICVRAGQIAWSPRTGNLVQQPLPDGPSPAATPALRLLQMKQIFDRFSADIGAWPAQGYTRLRPLSRPIYRYASEKENVVDGALFAMVLATDPELLIQIELNRDATGVHSWTYSVGRMAALKMKVRLDDREIWAVDGYWLKPRSVHDPYIEAMEENFVPGAGPAAKD